MLSAQFESPAVVLAVTQPVDFICVLSAGIFNTIRLKFRGRFKKTPTKLQIHVNVI